MHDLIERIRNVFLTGGYPNERAVSTGIVVPIMRALGWDDTDPREVQPEFVNPRGRVDYALSARAGERPIIFVEVKGVGRSAEADRQLFEYAFHEGVPMAVLTDGRTWNFYLPGQHGSYEERRVYQIDMIERETDEIVARFRRYLQKSRIIDRTALSDAQSDYQERANGRIAADSMPRAWAEILQLPDRELIQLLSERTEALSGHRPSEQALVAFLRNQIGILDGTTPVALARVPTRRAHVSSPAPAELAMAPTPIQASQPGKEGVRWRIRNQSGVGRNAVEAFVAALSALFGQFPNEQEKIAEAVATRGRNNIARTVADIYPSKPEIAARNHRALVDGWLVGTNESNATKARIFAAATHAVGLKPGVEVDLNI
jgi:hypothetical protein